MASSGIRLSVSQFQVFDEEMAAFARQLGINNIQMNTPALPGEKQWKYEDLKELKERIEANGLKLVMIENVPVPFYDKIILGLPGRDEQIENYCETIKNLGKLEIEILGHHFSPTFVWRTDRKVIGRGGCRVTAFDEDQFASFGNEAMRELMKNKKQLLNYDVFEVAAGLTADKLFENYTYFMRAVIPYAEEYNVKLALHPDDPPIRKAKNSSIERMITCLDDYKHAMQIAGSKMWGANLCLGCFSELGGRDTVIEALHFFLENKNLFSLHFRDVQGTLPSFKECFLGDGNFNPSELIEILIEGGYNGLIMEDHVAQMDYDTVYGHRARAHELGYIRGLIDMYNFKSKG